MSEITFTKNQLKQLFHINPQSYPMTDDVKQRMNSFLQFYFLDAFDIDLTEIPDNKRFSIAQEMTKLVYLPNVMKSYKRRLDSLKIERLTKEIEEMKVFKYLWEEHEKQHETTIEQIVETIKKYTRNELEYIRTNEARFVDFYRNHNHSRNLNISDSGEHGYGVKGGIFLSDFVSVEEFRKIINSI